jgi:hypothetical protein
VDSIRQNTAEAREVKISVPTAQTTNQSYSGDQPDAGLLHSTKAADSNGRHFINPQEIAEAAYHRWWSMGCPPGTAAADWFRAERELIRQREAAVLR